MTGDILQVESLSEIAPEKTASDYAPSESSQCVNIVENVSPLPYLEPVTSNGGVQVERWREMQERMRPALLCGKFGFKGFGLVTFRKYYKFIYCHKWFCSFCGKKGGVIHRRRMAKLIEKIGGYPKGTVLRQFVFTVPENIAEKFGSRAALNSLFRMSEKIIKKSFPGLKCVAYLHLFGDKGVFRFHPHINIHIWDNPGSLKMLPQETLDAMSETWRRALQGYVRQPVKVADIHCSFQTEPGKIKHRIKYMSRPNPDPKNLHDLRRDPDLLYFCTVVLSGFMFIRYFNGCRSKGIKDETGRDDLKAAGGLAGEKISWDFQDKISRVEFDYIYLPGDYDVLSPGYFMIHGP